MKFVIAMLLMVGCVAGSAASAAEQAVIGQSVTGKPPIRSIQVISFAPGGVLLIGDGAGSQIIAIDTQDSKSEKTPPAAITHFDKKLAAKIGAKADGVEIIDLAVNPASGRVYVAVRKQDDKSYLIVTVDQAGEIHEFELDNVRYAQVQLSAGDVKVSRITDVAWADDRLIAAGRSNETFASKIFTVVGPLNQGAKGNSYSAETYHVSHRRWETKAPMSVVLPFKENGKTYVVGAFSCTPVVKYPLDSLQPGAKVKGVSVMELGSGNRPIDMFLYEKGGKQFVLTNTFRFHHKRRPFGPSPYWTVKFERSILSANDAVNEQALRRLANGKPSTEKVEMVEAYHGVMQMDKAGGGKAVVLRQVAGGVNLEVLPLP